MRLIDADALIEFIENRYEITWKNDYEGGIKDACTNILEKISKMPTIEPERKNGKWIPVCRNKQCNCSVCNEGYDHTFEFIEKWNFCPNCGADMRGDDHDL